eukprot:scaffold198984_cov36-Tisochrysis_lutea.AAC.1
MGEREREGGRKRALSPELARDGRGAVIDPQRTFMYQDWSCIPESIENDGGAEEKSRLPSVLTEKTMTPREERVLCNT